jgi:hypothetical protein
MSQLARLGFLLLGLYLILEPLGGLGTQLGFARDGNFSAEALAYSAGWWAVFGLLPGVFLVLRARSIANYLFPPRAEEQRLDARALVTAGVAILGVYLLVGGLARAAGSAALALLTFEIPAASMGWAAAGVRGLLETACGVVLAVKASAIASFLFRSTRAQTAA